MSHKEVKNRNNAIGQNGNDGLVYLADIKYWKPLIDGDDLELINGDYKITLSSDVNSEYISVLYEVNYKDSFLTDFYSIKEALKEVCEHYERNQQ